MILSLLTAGVARLPNRLFGLVFSMVSGGRCLSLPLRARLSGVWYLRIRMLRLLAYNVNPCCSNLDPLNVNLRLVVREAKVPSQAKESYRHYGSPSVDIPASRPNNTVNTTIVSNGCRIAQAAPAQSVYNAP